MASKHHYNCLSRLKPKSTNHFRRTSHLEYIIYWKARSLGGRASGVDDRSVVGLIPHSTNNYQNLLPTVRVTPLNLFSASTVNLHGASNSNMFRNDLQIRLSPLKSPILRKYINPFKRPGMYPSISKCNAKKCNCCNHLCSKTTITITSSVNGRTFSVVNDSDLD